MRKILVIVFLFGSLSSLTYSQNPFTDNYPYKVGNIFIIKRTAFSFPGGSSTTYHTTKIVSDSIINGRRYFKLFNTPGNTFILSRLDTLTGALMQYDSLNTCSYYNLEKPIDSLWSSLGDTARGCGYNNFHCTDTSFQTLFGISVPKRTFYKEEYVGPVTVRQTRAYAKGFGNIYKEFSAFGAGGGGQETLSIIGCVINGIVYGDTSIPVTNVTQISSINPNEYSLHQNYPNPFNPSTRIKFDIPKGSLVKLKVYDMLGREVAELVNEKLAPGVYEHEWNGAGLPSGVYFYRLLAGEFVETRRMVLVK